MWLGLLIAARTVTKFTVPETDPVLCRAALSAGCYVCAPLAWMWMPVALQLAAHFAAADEASAFWKKTVGPLFLLTLIAWTALFAAWTTCAFPFMSALQQPKNRIELFILRTLTPFTFIAFALPALIIPAITIYLCIVIMSLS